MPFVQNNHKTHKNNSHNKTFQKHIIANSTQFQVDAIFHWNKKRNTEKKNNISTQTFYYFNFRVCLIIE